MYKLNLQNVYFFEFIPYRSIVKGTTCYVLVLYACISMRNILLKLHYVFIFIFILYSCIYQLFQILYHFKMASFIYVFLKSLKKFFRCLNLVDKKWNFKCFIINFFIFLICKKIFHSVLFKIKNSNTIS